MSGLHRSLLSDSIRRPRAKERAGILPGYRQLALNCSEQNSGQAGIFQFGYWIGANRAEVRIGKDFLASVETQTFD
jgi:hypothetical protein